MAPVPGPPQAWAPRPARLACCRTLGSYSTSLNLHFLPKVVGLISLLLGDVLKTQFDKSKPGSTKPVKTLGPLELPLHRVTSHK